MEQHDHINRFVLSPAIWHSQVIQHPVVGVAFDDLTSLRCNVMRKLFGLEPNPFEGIFVFDGRSIDPGTVFVLFDKCFASKVILLPREVKAISLDRSFNIGQSLRAVDPGDFVALLLQHNIALIGEPMSREVSRFLSDFFA